ncbi:MAG: UDP-N-acetylmuramoyl-tripeptide--D-alanyl-D-alanine ligase [Chlorobiaceae bacterium]|nr:UDP-N-acetylmuramoyl-tripeptide--D-alanyl-D-alanine ligase [Chlorobiaceae bacterium]NTW82215.1 UDP-N-acetylmuramoyl-tripeptide--D-alanyl-D-alanine ligase [Chlorobiaceae bacterium]
MKGVLTLTDLGTSGNVVTARAGRVSETIVDPVVVIDSRLVRGGEIFIALKGERTDGHMFIDDVFSKGAAWAMVNREWYAEAGFPEPPEGKGFIVTEDTVEGLQHLSALFRRTFSIPVVAVGGSNGKTTTKEMVASVLRTGFTVHMSRGNMNNHLGVPLTLLQLRQDTGIAVIEMGINHPGEMLQLADIARPTHGLLTNIGHEHLEFLHDLDGVAEEETSLFRYLFQNGGTIFVNDDDPRLKAAGTGLPGHIAYGLEDGSGHICSATEITVEPSGMVSFLLCSGTCSEKVSLNFTGKHNVINAVAAAAVGTYFGLSLPEIRRGLENLVPLSGWKRLEVIEADGLKIINDTYNANSDSMRLAIDTLCDMPCSGKRVAVLADMLELGAAGDVEHETIGRYIQQRSLDSLFTFGEKARLYCSEESLRCRGHFDSREKLLEALVSGLSSGDVVLFKGSRGMKLEEVVERLVKERETVTG